MSDPNTRPRLQAGKIAEFRRKHLAAQGGMCALCGHVCTDADAVLDHCHRTGAVRGVLHRRCNLFLGKIENAVTRNSITPDQLQKILSGYSGYVHKDLGTDHPAHRTPEERLERRRRRARLLRQAKKLEAHETQ